MALSSYGNAQHEFVKRVRDAIAAEGRACFKKKDWTCIAPSGGMNSCLTTDMTCHVETFYVKPVAVWIPHLLLPNFVPTCPHCKNKGGVDVANATFIKSPKTLHGIGSHRHLDTFMHQCSDCVRSFNGYNEASMELDGSALLGVFNFVCLKALQ